MKKIVMSSLLILGLLYQHNYTVVQAAEFSEIFTFGEFARLKFEAEIDSLLLKSGEYSFTFLISVPYIESMMRSLRISLDLKYGDTTRSHFNFLTYHNSIFDFSTTIPFNYRTSWGKTDIKMNVGAEFTYDYYPMNSINDESGWFVLFTIKPINEIYFSLLLSCFAVLTIILFYIKYKKKKVKSVLTTSKKK